MVDLFRRQRRAPPGSASPSPADLLSEYLRAPEAAATARLEALLSRLTPQIDHTLRLRWHAGGRGDSRRVREDFDDLRGEVLARLIQRLSEAHQGMGEPIRNVEVLVRLMTEQEVAARLREDYPQRTYLANRIRYLLTRCEKRTRLSMWLGEDRQRWCGQRQWRNWNPNPEAEKRRAALETEPRRCANWIFATDDPSQLELLAFLERLFDWLGAPLRFQPLVRIAADLRDVHETRAVRESAEESEPPLERVADPRGDPASPVQIRDLLRDIWFELGLFPLKQRRALVLTLSDGVIRLFPAEGLASVRDIAGLLEMPAEELAGLWPDLPLDDRAVAEQLQLLPRQIIVLRQNARDRLRRRLQKLGWDVCDLH